MRLAAFLRRRSWRLGDICERRMVFLTSSNEGSRLVSNDLSSMYGLAQPVTVEIIHSDGDNDVRGRVEGHVSDEILGVVFG